MKNFDTARKRLLNQKLSSSDFKEPADVVQWLGAVQAQDYNAAKWALGQRLHDATEATIENAFASGKILRTHVMRPTWHFVTPVDIRWLLQLTAPRVNARNAYFYRKLELDDGVFKRSNKALVKALRGGKQLTREALRAVVQRAGVASDDLLRFIHILARAELDGVICSGARQGKQFTYALLDERVQQTKALERDEALAELTRRYFTSHGPATLPDFTWWSGLSASDAKNGLDMVQRELVEEVIDGQPYWVSSTMQTVKRASQTERVCHLLAAFDEYFVSYKDRSAALDCKSSRRAIPDSAVLGSMIIIGGRVVGTWKRTLARQTVIITLSPFTRLTKADRQVIVDAAERYGAFLGMTVVLAKASV